MPDLSPVSPVRADYRFMRKLVSTVLGGKVEEVPSEFDFMNRIFSKAGGSWERIFHGSPKDVGLLKEIIKWAFKKDHLTKKSNWGSL